MRHSIEVVGRAVTAFILNASAIKDLLEKIPTSDSKEMFLNWICTLLCGALFAR